jgi:hypothetical protein
MRRTKLLNEIKSVAPARVLCGRVSRAGLVSCIKKGANVPSDRRRVADNLPDIGHGEELLS